MNLAAQTIDSDIYGAMNSTPVRTPGREFTPPSSSSSVRALVNFGPPAVELEHLPPPPLGGAAAANDARPRTFSRPASKGRRALLGLSATLGLTVAAAPWLEPLVGSVASAFTPTPGLLQLCLGGLVSLGGFVAHRRIATGQARADRAEAERDRLREFEVRALMVRGAAHDLKNLCVPLVVASDLLAEDLGPDASEELGSYIQTAADHATALLDRLVRAEVDGHHTPVACVGSGEIQRLRPLLARSLERRGHRFTCDVRDNVQVRLDRLDLAQAVVNLVTNAGYVREAPVHVHARSFAHQGRWCVEICDDAGGIPRAVLDRLFEEGTTAREGGSGLGLALTRHLVQRNDGTIDVDTDEVGTRFTLRFPARGHGERL